MRRIFVVLVAFTFLLTNLCFAQEKEQLDKQTVKSGIEKIAHEIFTCECNGDVESAKKYYDWPNYDIEPDGMFQKMYKVAFTQEMKAITERNWLKGKYNSLEMAYRNAGISQKVENYEIIDIKINNALDEAIVIYEHPIAREGSKFHKKNEKWLIYCDFFVN